MKLENQVSSLELSKKLKELGVKQESLFYWSGNPGVEYKLHNSDCGHRPETGGNDMFCSAFTSSELGEMLPEVINGGLLSTRRCNEGWYARYEDLNNSIVIPNNIPKPFIGEYHETEANCRAKMLIYLIENGLIKL